MRVLAAFLVGALGFCASGCGRSGAGYDLLRGDCVVESDAGARAGVPVRSRLRIGSVTFATLPAPPPSRHRFRCVVPQGARLRFSCGIDPRDHGGPAVDFVVSAGEPGAERPLWTRRLDPRALEEDARWVAGDVDLRAFAGRSVGLVLETRAAGGTPTPSGAAWAAPAVTGPRPGRLIVLYLVDTLRADHTGPYGYERKVTPQLDAFARDAAVFEQAVAPSSWTKASVASVLTGLLPSQHGAMLRSDTLAAGHLTLAEQLGAAGWSTGAVVANPLVYVDGAGFDQGFDSFAGLRGRRNRPILRIPASAVVDAALGWLDSRQGLSSFLYAHTMDPHHPYTPPQPFDRMFAELAAGAPAVSNPDSRERERREAIAAYDGEIAYGDEQFGRFVRGLKSRGLYDRATIVFLSDHGEEFLDHGDWRHGTSLYDEVVRVPLLVKFADGRGAGGRFASQVQLVDLARTVLEEAGLKVPATVGGRSLRGVVGGDARDVGPALLELAHRGNVAVASRTATEKYVWRFRPQDDSLRFDLARDPGERMPLAPPAPERQRLLRAQLQPLLRPNAFRHVLRARAAGRFELELSSTGFFEQVEALGLGPADRSVTADAGRTLRLRLEPRSGRPREVSFRLRPAGAPVRLSGTWDGRRLGVRDVSGAVMASADGALVLPDPEADPDPTRGAGFFLRPEPARTALAVWLERTDGSGAPAVSPEALEALRALGYVGK